MVDVIPVLLLVFGLVSAIKPEWIAVIHRRQKAAGTTHQPDEIEATETWLGVTRIGGIVFILIGFLLTIQNL